MEPAWLRIATLRLSLSRTPHPTGRTDPTCHVVVHRRATRHISDDLAEYGARAETRYQHSSVLQQIYGYRPFEGKNRKAILAWLNEAAERGRTNEQLAVEFPEEFRRRKIIVPGISTVERCCADALVVAERTITSRIAGRLNLNMRSQLLALLEETIDGRITRFVWLRQFELGSNSKDMNELLDRLGALREVGISADVFENIPPHRVASLRRQGERYSADGMRDLPANRRLAVLAACAFEWCAMVSDASVETHDRIVGKLYRSCERKRDEQLNDERTSIGDTLRAFSRFGEALVLAQEEKDNLDTAIVTTGGWAMFRQVVEQATALTRTVAADPLDFVTDGYARFRRYAPRFLDTLEFRGNGTAEPLLDAIAMMRRINHSGGNALPVNVALAFARPKWRRRICGDGRPDRQAWEIGLLFEIRNALRSGDLWLAESRRYQEVAPALLPMAAVEKNVHLAVPIDADDWLQGCSKILDQRLAFTGQDAGILAGGAIKDGKIQVDRLERAVPDEAGALVLKLYGQMPSVRITDILIEVDDRLGFTEAFTDLRTGIACRDRIGVMTVLLADGVNLGLRKMADGAVTLFLA